MWCHDTDVEFLNPNVLPRFITRVVPSLPCRALMKMDSDLLLSPAAGLAEEEEADMDDWKLPLAFMKKRHCEKIEGSKALAQSWRMKDRVSVSAYLVLLLLARSNQFMPSC